MAKHMPHIERFFQKVDKSGNEKFPDCWIWTGAPTSRNYGSFSFYTKKPAIGAHVSSYLFHKGDVPKGMLVCHHCDNPPCVNPEHLFLDTNSGNMRDMMKKGRHGWTNRERTHCRRGHEFEVFGVIKRTKKDGTSYRTCKECIKINRKNNKNK